MQAKLNSMESTAKQAGLKSHHKTKSMRVNGDGLQPQGPFYDITSNYVENLDSFTYLGTQIILDNDTMIDINSRKQKAQGTFAQLRNIWPSTQHCMSTKLCIFNSKVKSVLLYGCETWYKVIYMEVSSGQYTRFTPLGHVDALDSVSPVNSNK